MEPEPGKQFEFYDANVDLHEVFSDHFPDTLRAMGLVAIGLDSGTHVLQGGVDSIPDLSSALLNVMAQIRNELLKVRPVGMKMEFFGDVINDLSKVREILFKAVGDSVLSPSAADEICRAIHDDLFSRFLKENDKRIADEAGKALAENELRANTAFNAGYRTGRAEVLKAVGKKKTRKRKK